MDGSAFPPRPRDEPDADDPGPVVARDRAPDRTDANATPADKERFLAGLTWIDTRSTALDGKAFAAATPDQQAGYLTGLAAPSGHAAEDAPGVPFFTGIKGLTISGYYSTRIGLEQELGDNGQLFAAVFEGCTHKEHKS